MSVQMKKVAVVIETARHRIYGKVAVPAVARLSDYANDPERTFFALTHVRLSPLEHPERERAADFMLVNRQDVAVMLPEWGEQKADSGAWVFDEFMDEQSR